MSLLHLLDLLLLDPQPHICETWGKAEQLLLGGLTCMGHRVPVPREPLAVPWLRKGPNSLRDSQLLCTSWESF